MSAERSQSRKRSKSIQESFNKHVKSKWTTTRDIVPIQGDVLTTKGEGGRRKSPMLGITMDALVECW